MSAYFALAGLSSLVVLELWFIWRLEQKLHELKKAHVEFIRCFMLGETPSDEVLDKAWKAYTDSMIRSGTQ